MSQELPEWVVAATTLGLSCKDGVILASEKRMSLGYLIMSKSSKKVFKITDKIGAACAGLTSDFQTLVRQIKSLTKLYELENKREISVKAAAKLISTLLFNKKRFPYITQTIIGGFDSEGASIYTLDLFGSLIKDKFAAVGTGAKVAIGVLESKYFDDISVAEGEEIAISAIKSAIERDIGSGNGIDLLKITSKGVEEKTLSL